MTAGTTRGGTWSPAMRRHVVPVLAATGAWTVGLVGVAPPTVAAEGRPQQWYLDAMQAEEMWKVSTGKGIKIAVIDSGVDASVPSLKGQLLPGKDVTGEPGGPNDDPSGHGTNMAELIVGTGRDGGLKGLAPGAQVIPFRTSLSEPGKPDDEYVSSVSHKAIRAAADSDARIINLSVGGEYYDALSQEAVTYAAKKGKLLFAAVGNDGQGKNKIEYPAGYPEVTGVAAVDPSAKASKSSTHGPHVDLAAPGADIPYRCPDDPARYCDGDGGTSAATALASASAALIWSEHPDWTANQVLRVLMETAGKPKDGKVPSTYVGYGVVRPSRVLLNGEGEPGPAGQHPLDPGGSTTASPSSPGSSDAGDGEKNGADTVDVADPTDPDDDGSQLWIILGAAGAVAVLGAGAFALMRMRRR